MDGIRALPNAVAAGQMSSADRVPFLDLRRETRALREGLLQSFERVLDSGRFLFGPELDAIEAALGQTIGIPHVIGVASGTCALEIMLLAHGIGPGDEVITTAASFYSTAKAIDLVGATAVFADIDPDQYNLDPATVEAAIGPRTRAILVVHLYGCPGPVRELRSLADRHGLLLFEDAAQAFGAQVAARPVGSWGDSAVLSFYPTKTLGGLGDAGAILTGDAIVADRARSLRFLGYLGRRDHFAAKGVSGRMDEIQAAMLGVKLKHAATNLERRRTLSERYDRLLPRAIVRPLPAGDVKPAHYLYVVRSPNRDGLLHHLREHGIECEVHYGVGIHRQQLFAHRAHHLPVTDAWSQEVLSLPLYPYLELAEQDRVVAAVISFLTTS
jgi:dTDP-4-amino-4,6-dideoxygalactose transaminase